MLETLAHAGVLAVPMSGKVRFITHRDVDAPGIAEALHRIERACERAIGTALPRNEAAGSPSPSLRR
jgi:hypothetical protein